MPRFSQDHELSAGSRRPVRAESSASAPRSAGAGDSGTDAAQADANVTTGAVLLYTPAQAAELLQVPESWLRRRAGARRVPCSFLGKHLRFSRADLEAIVRSASAAHGESPAGRGRSTHRR